MQTLAFLSFADQAGLEVLVYCTYRTVQEQAALFRNGRGLKAIEVKAEQLAHEHNRLDLAELLLDTPPQYGESILTYAGPGESLHNYAAAFDAVPCVNGKPQWDEKRKVDVDRWMAMGELAERCGIEWAGNWSETRREFPHFQMREFSWKERIRDESFPL